MTLYRLAGMALSLAGFLFLCAPSPAAPIANCNASFTGCGIPENILLQLPFVRFAGDVVLTEPNSSTVSDVFRIFNNLVNTGAGTGQGNMVFLYSSDDSTPLPAASTYSANVVFIPESPTGITPFLGNGTNYLLGVPEPRSFELLMLGVAAMLVFSRRRLRKSQADL